MNEEVKSSSNTSNCRWFSVVCLKWPKIAEGHGKGIKEAKTEAAKVTATKRLERRTK